MRRPINTVNGTYKDPNLSFSAQDALNVIPMMTEKGGTRTVSQYRQAPGLKPFCRIGTNSGGEVGFVAAGAGRGLRVVDGNLYAVAGRNLWQITSAGVSVNYGTIPGVGRVSMAHNQRGLGNELAIDNGQSRYVFNTQTKDLQKVTDPSFPGSIKAFFIDGYIGYIEPQGRYWGHSDLSNALNYNSFDEYEAEGQPDRIVTGHVSNREVLIAGQDTIEAYVNSPSGSGEAPFVRATNTVIESGCSARDSFCTVGQFTVYLDQNRTVQVLNGYTPVPISTAVIDSALQACTKQQIANAYAFAVESEGFQIYYLTVPGKFTFGYDFKNREWHRRSSTGLDWWAVTDVVQWNGSWYALDSRRGDILELRWYDYPFDVQEELVREWVTGSVSADQNPVYVHELELLFGCGGRAYTTVDFPDQPTGPSISGEAPDAVPGEAYSFAYTTTPGDSPIARTSLRAGSYVLVDGVQKTLSEAGWTWNQSTATVSIADPVASSVVLKLRTFDESGLYDDHDDSFEILEAYEILVSGQTLGLGQPYMCKFNNVGDTTIVGIAQGAGATLGDAVCGYSEDADEWAAIGLNSSRFAASLSGSWTTGTAPSSSFGEVFPDTTTGWIACIASGGAIASEASNNFTSLTRTATTPGDQGALNSAYRTMRLYDPNEEKWWYYSLADYHIFRCEDPRTDTWNTLFKWPDSSSTARALSDLCWVGGRLYGVGIVDGPNDYGLCWSDNGGASWPVANKVFQNTTIDPAPIRLANVQEILVVYCIGGYLRTESSSWAPIPPVISGVSSGIDIPLVAQARSRIRSIGGLLYMLGTAGDANKYVTFNPVTQDFGTPVTLPITNAVGIAARKL